MIKYLFYSTLIVFLFSCIKGDSHSYDSGISVNQLKCDETEVTRIVFRSEENVLLEGYSIYLFQQGKKKVRLLINNFPRELGKNDSLLSFKITTSQKGYLSSSRYKLVCKNADSVEKMICVPLLDNNKITLIDSNTTHISDAMIPANLLTKEGFRNK